MRRNVRIGGRVGLGLALAAGLLVLPGAQGRAQTAARACRARQVEVYQEGGDAGLGSGRQIVGLRNISGQTCALAGIPRLEFFDKAGNRLAIPYGKNQDAMMFQAPPEKPVTLAPGNFAYFMIGTTNGDQSQHFGDMRVLLPGDDTPLGIGWGEGGALDSIDVSAVVAGVNTEDGFAVPSQEIAVAGGALPGLTVTLHVPEQPKGPFDAHLTAINTGASPRKLGAAQCSLSGQLVNSADKTVWETERCGAWAGEIDAGGLLRPGARATADVQLGEVALQLCRAGTWTAKFALETSLGTVRFAGFPFEVVNTTGCSDSEHTGVYVDENAIRWTLVPQHGVRLGVAVRGKDGAGPATVPFSDRNPRLRVPEFHAGEPIELVLYLDDQTDQPLEWPGGPDAIRVAMRVSGKGAMLTPLPAHAAQSAGPDTKETVLPHTWRYIQTVELNSRYALGPGSYDVIVGTLGLKGGAAAANSPATGWPYTEGSAAVETFVKIVP